MSMTWCWSTPRRWSAAARLTPPGARSWRRPAHTTAAAATAAGFGACACTVGRAGRHPRAAILASADQKERDVALRLFEIGLHGGELVVCDKGYAGREVEQAARERFGATVLRPAPKTEPGRGPALSWIGQLLDAQRPLRPRTPPRLHAPPTTGADRDQTPRARRGRRAQPRHRPAHPQLRRARRLTPRRGINHRAVRPPPAARCAAASARAGRGVRGRRCGRR
jgi:hypothetical protein